MKRVLLFMLIGLVCCTASFSVCASDRKHTDTNTREITLNKHQLACLAVAIREMQRRGWPFRDYQVLITDLGSSYSIAFMDDPLGTNTGGNGMEWHVRKRDLKLSGPTFYK